MPDRAQYLLTELGLTGQENPASMSGGEGAGRRWRGCWRRPRHPAAGRADQPPRPARDRVAGAGAEIAARSAMVLISHDRRFPDLAVARDDLARSRRDAAGGEVLASSKPGATRCWTQEELDRRRKLDRKIARRGGLAALWRQRAARCNQRRLGELHALRDQRRMACAAQPAMAVLSCAARARPPASSVIEAIDISLAYDDNVVVEAPVAARGAWRSDRLVGPNGAGKTTLINLLTGALATDSGRVKLGTALEMGDARPASRESLDPDDAARRCADRGGGSIRSWSAASRAMSSPR